MIHSKKVAAAALASGALITAIGFAAPAAQADISRVDVAPGLSFGSSSSYGTGCSYQVTASAPPDDALIFVDETANDRTTQTLKPSYLATDVDGKATVTWTPTTKGAHRIWVRENHPGATPVTASVNVGTGIQLGPICLVLP
ncbi:hypothetical protein [Nocardia arthritidis]|uniref:Ig-like domain repeat protein n=1 Tax=Nocardia arthritidis TaxID=228602 RepID=A0A6G9YEF8_9NOCA|nr:hypothetical protein [Nocardia arthritidis]QIS11510.1 hypothetical protein F5544_18180 [Nocardia arthritidis]